MKQKQKPLKPYKYWLISMGPKEGFRADFKTGDAPCTSGCVMF